MFGLRERSYPAHVLISFWCDSDNELFLSISSMHIGPRKFSLYLIFHRFSAFSTKFKMAAKIVCRSLELEPLYGFVSLARIISKYLKYAYWP